MILPSSLVCERLNGLVYKPAMRRILHFVSEISQFLLYIYKSCKCSWHSIRPPLQDLRIVAVPSDKVCGKDHAGV